jgi:hypothetical protein
LEVERIFETPLQFVRNVVVVTDTGEHGVHVVARIVVAFVVLDVSVLWGESWVDSFATFVGLAVRVHTVSLGHGSSDQSSNLFQRSDAVSQASTADFSSWAICGGIGVICDTSGSVRAGGVDVELILGIFLEEEVVALTLTNSQSVADVTGDCFV